MASTIAECPPTRLPVHLPDELWIMILVIMNDPITEWFALRPTSQQLRRLVTESFRTNHLRQHVRLTLNVSDSAFGHRRLALSYCVTLKFDRYDPNNEDFVIFSESKRSRFSGAQPRPWDQAVARYNEGQSNLPPWLVYFAGEQPNDTELPDLSVDTQAHELRFRWQGMLQCFFRERLMMQRLQREFKAKDVAFANYLARRGTRRRRRHETMPNGARRWASVHCYDFTKCERQRIMEFKDVEDTLPWFGWPNLPYSEQKDRDETPDLTYVCGYFGQW